MVLTTVHPVKIQEPQITTSILGRTWMYVTQI